MDNPPKLPSFGEPSPSEKSGSGKGQKQRGSESVAEETSTTTPPTAHRKSVAISEATRKSRKSLEGGAKSAKVRHKSGRSESISDFPGDRDRKSSKASLPRATLPGKQIKPVSENDNSSRRSVSLSSGKRTTVTPEETSPYYETDQTELELGQDEMSSFGESEEYSYPTEAKDETDVHETDAATEQETEKEDEATIRARMLQEAWERISMEIRRSFDAPSRVYKLRRYHSEPDLSLPFEDKFEPRMDQFEDSQSDGGGGGGISKKRKSLLKSKEKYLSLEDIPYLSGKEHPDLVHEESSELRLKASAVTDKLKCTWMELVEMEKKRYSIFDELFAMGYIVDSLEVPSPPPKGEEGKGEYFVEAEERHYRKKVDYGRVVFKTKHVYTGNFQDWYFEGPGRYSWEDGTVYQGEFSRGVMHGPGSIQWPDGCIYDGTFIKGIRTGWGVYSSADGQTFAGEWLGGLPHGHGKMWYDPDDDDNDYYEGQWEKGLHQGIGTRQYATGDRYVGNWSQGMRNGYGIMIWLRERQVYKGDWMDGIPHGFGKHIWYLERTASNSFPTRHVYQGAWNEGMRQGVGKMIYPCGSVYEGSWKNGQRHGKGMFINPAGDILVGLFRAGAIVGGSEVPLHAPTYECDFGGLTEWLTAKFGLVFQGGNSDEEGLHATTKLYLPYIRKLYHRAGEYSQKYGNHGLYPAYMKKYNFEHNQMDKVGKQALHRDYTRTAEADHMKGKAEKPESLDGVNPVTRFGMWLLIKDCDGLLDEVTMAYYDQIWSETPPLSFQTKHNPFEPVYLWQFLQALIVVAVAYYMDIPRQKQEESRSTGSKDIEAPAVSETTLNSGISFEEHKRKMNVLKHRNRVRKYSMEEVVNITQQVAAMQKGFTRKAKTKVKRRQQEAGGEAAPSRKPTLKERIKSMASLTLKEKRTSKEQRMSGNDEDPEGELETPASLAEIETLEEEPSFSETPEEDSEKLKSMKGHKKSSVQSSKTDGASPKERMNGEQDTEEHGTTPSPGTIAECLELFLTTKLLPCLKRDPGVNLPVVPHPLPALVDMYDSFKAIKNRDILKGTEFIQSILPHMQFPSPDDALWWHRSPEPLSINVDLQEIIQTYKDKFVDEEEDEGISYENFIAVPSAEGGDSESTETAGNEYLGVQAQQSDTTLKLLHLENKDRTSLAKAESEGAAVADNDSECAEDEHENENPQQHHSNVIEMGRSLATARATIFGNLLNFSDSDGSLTEFIAEGHPFAEEELAPQPFLWADDYKCIPAPRKYQHFKNINTQDLFQAIRELYPRLCVGSQERELNFDFIFCDWLWCTSLLAKASTEREFQGAWQVKGEQRTLTSPQSYGVYAHYIKQIKNNPYLSPTPPPGFHPKRPERKGVKFSERK